MSTNSSACPTSQPKGLPSKKNKGKKPKGVRPQDGSPPIHKLDPDILWYIFSLNAPADSGYIWTFRYTEANTALDTTRKTSQVCRTWRELTLSSSSIWANALNLQSLDQKTDHWRDEVFRRTGHSLLTVQGDLKQGQPSAQFFLSILPDHWTRMRGLFIHVHQDEYQMITKDKRWLTLQHPAPNLQFFNLHLPRDISTTNPVLSDYAPHLLSFSCSRVSFNLSSPWLSRICELSLQSTPSFTVPQFLHVLADMPLLEDLDLSYSVVSDAGIGQERTLPTITRPRLEDLHIIDTAEISIALFSHIMPSIGCAIDIYAENYDKIPALAPADLSLLCQSLARYFGACSQGCPVETLSWTMTEDLFALGNNVNKNITFLTPYIPLFLSFSLQRQSPSWSEIPDAVFQGLSLSNLTTVKMLELDVCKHPLDPFNPALHAFFTALTRVRVMHGNSEAIRLLVDIQAQITSSVILPCLQTIVFDTRSKLQSAAIIHFLIRRREAGVPITTFDLQHCLSNDQDQLSCLKGIDDLKVIWNDEVRERMECSD